MLTYPRTTVFDFSVEPQQQILTGNTARIWLQLMSPTNAALIGIDYVQQIDFFANAYIVAGPGQIVLTKGDLGSILGNALFATTGNPAPYLLYVTEVLLL